MWPAEIEKPRPHKRLTYYKQEWQKRARRRLNLKWEAGWVTTKILCLNVQNSWFLSRTILGDDITIQADANGSYDVEHAIKFGHKLQDVNAYLFEEPCRFDHIEQTKQVADALDIAISGGEQEASEYRFKQMLAKNVLQVVQPDLHYYGGFIRTTRLARMAQVLEVPITLHISDRNAGFAEMVNFSSFTPNIGKFQELKSGMQATAYLFDPPIVAKNGFLNIPSAPGLGMKHGSEHIKNAKKVISHS